MGSVIKWLFLALLPIVFANDYCSLCSNHTMCRFTSKSPACGKSSEGGVSPAEAKHIVDLHNAYRARIAHGQETRGKPGPQPPAGNMQALVWDDKLAEVAQRWADQCTFQHDQCRNDPRFKVGQNIYLSSGFSTVNWTRAVNSWYNEVDDFSAEDINSFKPNPKTGRFTQIAWAKTTHIGCGRTTFKGAYRPYEYRPQEFVLPEIPLGNNAVKNRVARHNKPGFFGGATYDSSGAKGAITTFSKRVSGSSGSLSGNQPSPFFGGNFLNHGIGDIMQNDPGFFGGATFNPVGAQGAITATSAGASGITGSMSGNQPSMHFGITQNNPGFFGGADFNPAGAQGAITAFSAGIPGGTGSPSGNQASPSFGGNFLNHGIDGITQNNPGFFGGATFNSEGALGAITATSAGIPGGTASPSGNQASPSSGGNFLNHGIDGITQNNPGFFGGATFNSEGALGAITATSAGNSGSTGSSNGKRPLKPIVETFLNNGIGDITQNNPGFFGGATFNSEGALGAITATSAEISGNTGSSNGKRPLKPIVETFLNNGIGDITQNNPGFFGGATFNSEGALGAITASSPGISGNTGSSNGNRPLKPIGENFLNNGIGDITQNNPGFFGGATFNSDGALGAITASSPGISGNTGSSNGNRPLKPTGENFLNNGIGDITQSNPGFFGGATFNSEGALGAITATSAGISGSTGSSSGNRPLKPIGENFLNNGFGDITQSNPGFFGGATFNPEGALGAITATSAGMSGGTGVPNNNQPSRPTGGHFPSNVNGGTSSNYPDSSGNYPTNTNNPDYPNYQNGGNGPYYPSYPDFPGDYPGDYDFNSGNYLQSFGYNLMNMPKGSVQGDNEGSPRQRSSNSWIPLPEYHNLVGQDQILICNYGPSGNSQGESLYMQGEECSHCPTGTTCSSGLCVAS